MGEISVHLNDLGITPIQCESESRGISAAQPEFPRAMQYRYLRVAHGKFVRYPPCSIR